MNIKVMILMPMTLCAVFVMRSPLHAVIYDEAAFAQIKDPVTRSGLERLFDSLEPSGAQWEEVPRPQYSGPTHAVNAVETRLFVDTSEKGRVKMVALTYPKEGPIPNGGKVMIEQHVMELTDDGDSQYGIKISRREISLHEAESLRRGSNLVSYERVLDYPVVTRCVDASCARIDGTVTTARASQSTSIAFLGDLDRQAVGRVGEMEGDLAKSEISTMMRPWRTLLGTETLTRPSEAMLGRNADAMLKGRYVGKSEVMALFRNTMRIFH